MSIINLTPHGVNLKIAGKMVEIPSSGLARCACNESKVGEVDGIAIYRNSYGEVTGLPEPQKDTIYIVSRIVAEALRGSRNDVYIVTKTIRNSDGQIVGAEGLAVI